VIRLTQGESQVKDEKGTRFAPPAGKSVLVINVRDSLALTGSSDSLLNLGSDLKRSGSTERGLTV